MRPRSIAIGLALILASGAAAPAAPLTVPWPDAERADGIETREVAFPTFDPFTPADAADRGETGVRQAHATLFLPRRPPAAAKIPAVILLHGAGGVIWNREMTYGRQFAAMGVAALVIDAFAARRDLATGFVNRVLNITESMMMADAYAALIHLVGLERIDRRRVVLIGFSYGGMVSVFAAYDQIARSFAPDGQRFAAHVSFYGPCIARFDEHKTTGAPVLMLAGTRDIIMDRARCDEIAADLRDGGSTVTMRWYEGAWHQWDGAFDGPRPIGRNLAPCRLRVSAGGGVWDRHTGLPMLGPLTRRIILATCIENEPYLIGRDDAVRARSNADLTEFLNRTLAPR